MKIPDASRSCHGMSDHVDRGTATLPGLHHRICSVNRPCTHSTCHTHKRAVFDDLYVTQTQAWQPLTTDLSHTDLLINENNSDKNIDSEAANCSRNRNCRGIAQESRVYPPRTARTNSLSSEYVNRLQHFNPLFQQDTRKLSCPSRAPATMELESTNGAGPLVFKCTCSHVCTQTPQARQRPSPRSVKAGKHTNTTNTNNFIGSSAIATDQPVKLSCLTDPNEYFSAPAMTCLDSGCLGVREFGTDHDVLGSPRPLRSDLANAPSSVSGARHVLVTATTAGSGNTTGNGGLVIDQNKLSRQPITNHQLRIPSGSMLVAVPASAGQFSRTHPGYVQQTLSHAPHLSHNQHPHHHHHHHHHHLPSAQTLGHTRNASLPHSQLVHLTTNTKSPPTCLVIPAQCHIHSGHTTVASLSDAATSHGHTVQTHPPSSSSAPASAAQLQQLALAKHQARQQEKRRKRIYRIGLNIFNKSPLKGIEFLIKYGFLDCTPETVARFLLTRKGLSRVAIGDYLGNTKDELAMTTTRQFMRELDFREQEVDDALRSLLSCFRTPGESQKIVHLLTEFQAAYIEQNSARVKAQFRNPDSVMVLAYAIVMLHTDMYSPNVRPQSKMTRDEFVRNLRGVDAGEDLDRNLLLAIYDRIQQREMSVAPDHTDQVRKIQQHLTGPLRPLNLALPQRRLVCYCRLYEVPDKNKRERPGAHQREVFLFNDLLLITKAVQKKRRDAAIAYQVRVSLNLLGVRLVAFETPHHPHGLELLLPIGESNVSLNSKESGLNPAAPLTPDGRARILVTLNTKTLSDRARFMEDLQECIVEVAEMDRIRIEDEVAKQMQQKRRLSKQLSTAATVGNHLMSSCKSNGNHNVGSSNGSSNSLRNNNNNNTYAFMSSQNRVKMIRVLGEDRAKRPSDWAHARLTASALSNGKAIRAKTVPREFEAMVRRGIPSNMPMNMASGELRETVVPRPDVLDTKCGPTKSSTEVPDAAEENQRLSGDSGLLADLETPTSQCSRVLGSNTSYSPS
ncbi:unnamed protein product [Echinostoma caproni]|uniref:SEC7 domain-containing protein n=1 Tax=Echinostoma caproni TaxID=27848 RepID=A0A183A8K0_9TREM|nr:unnamed protein product [Echinostoma caproni]